MSEIKTIQKVTHYIYGLDMRDPEDIQITYDSGNSDHPGNWGIHINKSIPYDSYKEAKVRMNHIYSEIRGESPANLAGISLGIITCVSTHSFNEQTAQERMDEINKMFTKSNRQ